LLEEAASDDAVRVVVLTGAGKGFCAGGDLAAMSSSAGGLSSFTSRAAKTTELRRWMRTSQLLHQMPKVTIAAINGACAGAGLSLACACDLRYAAVDAKFSVAFRNAGLSGDFGGTWTLPRIVGPAKARELYLRSQRFDAKEAERIGLVSGVTSAEGLLPLVMEVARDIADAAPLAVQGIKQNLNDSFDASFTEQLDTEAERHVRGTETEDHIEAAKAFLDKRKPVFRGR
jgi:2-(1,2-epoxy-1,2-dihydrophenyl)acetyl-CoA isomerase